MKYDIIIAYRCYPGISKKPFFRKNNKLDMIKYGLKSMRLCLWWLHAKFIIIDDGCPEHFQKEIKKVLDWYDIEYIQTDKIWNFATYKMQLDLLSQQNESEIVYLAEDDYLYSEKWFEEAIDLLKKWIADFITLFDHKNYYKARHHSIKAKYHLTNTRIWKTAPSTCLTFMTTKKTLIKAKSTLILFTKWCRDHPMWLILTKYNLFRFFDIDRKNRIWKTIPSELVYVIMARIYWFRHILFSKKYKLFVPVPSIATHLESEDIAPLVNREKIKSNLGKAI